VNRKLICFVDWIRISTMQWTKPSRNRKGCVRSGRSKWLLLCFFVVIVEGKKEMLINSLFSLIFILQILLRFAVGNIPQKAVWRSAFFINSALKITDCFFGDFAHWVYQNPYKGLLVTRATYAMSFLKIWKIKTWTSHSLLGHINH